MKATWQMLAAGVLWWSSALAGASAAEPEITQPVLLGVKGPAFEVVEQPAKKN